MYMYMRACIYSSACVMKLRRGFSTSVVFIILVVGDQNLIMLGTVRSIMRFITNTYLHASDGLWVPGGHGDAEIEDGL